MKRPLMIGGISIIIITVLLGSFFLLGNTVFLLKHVKIQKDFPIDANAFYKELNIYPQRPLWFYNTRAMEKKLASQIFIGTYRVRKVFPDTLEFELSMKKPLGKISDEEGNYFYFDNKGILYSKAYNINSLLPELMIDAREKISVGKRLGGNYRNTIRFMQTAAATRPVLFREIATISIKPQKYRQTEYILQFRAKPQKITLKNAINVDSITEGYIASLFLEQQAINKALLHYTNNGYAY